MNRVYVVVAVDVTGALAASTLQGFVYLVDSNGYLGSWQEGQSALATVCQDGQRITWSVAAVDPGSSVSIAGFSGPLIDQKFCVPTADPYSGPGVWNGQVEAQGAYAEVSYSVALALGSTQLSFDAALKSV